MQANPPQRRALVAAWALLTALVGVGALGVSCGQPPAVTAKAPEPTERRLVQSNVLRGDYAGSASCKDCHGEIYQAWSGSPMHQMTREAGSAPSRAPFADGEYHFKGDRIRMEERAGQRFMHLSSAHEGEATYRITRVIGGRHREDYAAVRVPSVEEAQRPMGEERVMPVSYVYETAAWRYKGYSVLVKERSGLRVGGVWRQACVFCHNTVPYASYLYDELLGDRAGGYQGSMTTYLMPEERRFGVSVSKPDELAAAIHSELELLGAPRGAETGDELSQLLRRAIGETQRRFGPEHFIELGVGCESCHGGSKEHAQNPSVRTSIAPRSPLLREHIGPEQREPTPAEALNQSCMHCHTVLFSRYPYTWEGGRRNKNPGGSNINSGEARDFMLGACASEMSCANCHDPHARDAPEALRALTTLAGNGKCTSCHQELAQPSALAKHSHHDPKGEGSACMACHMPRKNLSLNYRLTSYHRIGSPTDPERALKDRPLECALCHTETSTEALASNMERWWGKRYDRAALRRLYGHDLSRGNLETTARFGLPHEQAVAVSTLGARGRTDALRLVSTQLSHEYPLVRYFAGQAARELTGSWPSVDVEASAAEVRSQVRDWLSDVKAREDARQAD